MIEGPARCDSRQCHYLWHLRALQTCWAVTASPIYFQMMQDSSSVSAPAESEMTPFKTDVMIVLFRPHTAMHMRRGVLWQCQRHNCLQLEYEMMPCERQKGGSAVL